MKRLVPQLLFTGMLVVCGASVAQAQTTVTLPDTSQITTFTANVSEQARVTVPATITFAITDVSAGKAASAASVTIDNIVLATATKQLKLSIQASAANFTPPVVGATTWTAGDITWNAPTWTNATGSSGTLSSSAYTAVTTCAANASTCSTTGLVFTIGAKATVNRSGSHTLTATWKVESIGS